MSASTENMPSEISWFNEFLVRTSRAETLRDLALDITGFLRGKFPFSYVSVFFPDNGKALCLSAESEDLLIGAGLTEIRLDESEGKTSSARPFNSFLAAAEFEKHPALYEETGSLTCEFISSQNPAAGLICYRIGVQNLSPLQRWVLDLAKLQAELSLERICRDQERNDVFNRRMAVSAEIEKVVFRSDRQSCLAEMALGVADGIRNPITVIGGLLRRISKRTDFNPLFQKDWDILLHEAERLEGLVSDFENLAHRREILFETSDINEIVHQVIRIINTDYLKDRPGNFVLELESPACLTKIDKRLMGAALTHLLLNALDATDGEGVITISSRTEEKYIRLEIRDEGKGVSAEFLDHIFDPFFSTKSGGTGLGLTYVQQIIQEHRGEIKVESRPGNGATFILILPRNGCKDPVY